ncbi:hypothetical protein NUW58_g9490 [Xylaria curta]|uniref:Uncharacterized protein n=1 Tax=Xylaria curta TaxID=42375 RepID=A0ACC1MX04_9PEZI|nr:hypothetical protein NUW58_g9490 [Xylaria curta]
MSPAPIRRRARSLRRRETFGAGHQRVSRGAGPLRVRVVKEDEAHTAALYAGRAVLPYLITANVRAANTSYRVFTDALNEDKESQLGVQDVSSNSDDLRVFPSIPLLNFLGLLFCH